MKNMMKKSAFAAFVFVLAMLVTAPITSATTITEVQTQITSLKDKTAAVGGVTEKSRTVLLGKLNEASLKLDQGKFCDALQKIGDFKANINALAAAPKTKINQDPTLGVTAQELIADADAIIAGINDLVVQSGTTCPTTTF